MLPEVGPRLPVIHHRYIAKLKELSNLEGVYVHTCYFAESAFKGAVLFKFLTKFGLALLFKSSSRISLSPNPVAIRTGVSLYCKNRRKFRHTRVYRAYYMGSILLQ